MLANKPQNLPSIWSVPWHSIPKESSVDTLPIPLQLGAATLIKVGNSGSGSSEAADSLPSQPISLGTSLSGTHKNEKQV